MRLGMCRIRILALVLAVCPLASSQNKSAPTVRFSFYAPAQKDPPVHIVGLQRDQDEVRFVLSNASDKQVTSVIIARVDIAPPGCAPEPVSQTHWSFWGSDILRFKAGIAPHGTTTDARMLLRGRASASRPYPNWPRRVVEITKADGVGYMQAQFGVTGVLFADKTAWPAQLAFVHHFDPFKEPSPDEFQKIHALYPSHPFDPSLADAEAEKCADVAAAASALQSTKEIIFEPGSIEAPNPADVVGSLPQLHFGCSLKGPTAVCRMP